VELGVGRLGERVAVDGPISTDRRTSESERASGVLRLGSLSLAGLYGVRTGAIDVAVPVNLLEARESSLTGPPPAAPPSVEEIADAPRGGVEAARRELWPELVMVAVALLALEWGIYLMRMRA
ncbi:MAG: hypothetical protein AAFU70_04565, partial [Planctomycetota bacterium]